MKKVLCLLLLCALASALPACSRTPEESEVSEVSEVQTWTPADFAAPLALEELSYRVPSSWIPREGDSDKELRWASSEDSDALKLSITTTKRIPLSFGNHKDAENRVLLEVLLSDFCKEPTIKKNRTLCGYPAIIAEYDETTDNGTVACKICIILSDQYSYVFILSEPGQLTAEAQSFMDTFLTLLRTK